MTRGKGERNGGLVDDVDAFLWAKIGVVVIRTDVWRLPVDGPISVRREGGALIFEAMHMDGSLVSDEDSERIKANNHNFEQLSSFDVVAMDLRTLDIPQRKKAKRFFDLLH